MEFQGTADDIRTKMLANTEGIKVLKANGQVMDQKQKKLTTQCEQVVTFSKRLG